jgi:hypothetical protein
MNNNRTVPFRAIFVIGLVACIAMGWRWTRPAAARTSSAPRSRMVSTAATASAAPAKPTVSDVDIVKATRLLAYPAQTVGEAFRARFQSPEWAVVPTKNGDRVVAFTGTVKYTVFRDAGFYIGTWNGVQQGIEFARVRSDQEQTCQGEASRHTSPSASAEAVTARCMEKADQATVIPLRFQFTLDPHKNQFEMTSMDPVFQSFDPDHWLRSHNDATLAFIFGGVSGPLRSSNKMP